MSLLYGAPDRRVVVADLCSECSVPRLALVVDSVVTVQRRTVNIPRRSTLETAPAAGVDNLSLLFSETFFVFVLLGLRCVCFLGTNVFINK